MHNCIIGTAGHVDHGKTALIEALTGHNTDRLIDEKKRHITIDLGYAPLVSGDPRDNIAIIDVPGHRDYLKNMLAGSCGIDFVLLTVALNEGVMPQTKEHLEILDNLYARDGIVVYTKCDLEIDCENRKRIYREVDELVQGTFLEDAPRIEISAHTSKNIAELKEVILERIHALREKETGAEEEFYMPVDRVFSIDGIGTIATGSVLDGFYHRSDKLYLYPQNKEVKVRGMQSCSLDIESAASSQRVALNLKNIDRASIARGDVLARRANWPVSNNFLCRLKLLQQNYGQLKNNKRIFINIGTKRLSGRIVLLDANCVSKGETALAKIILDGQYPLRYKEKFIISDLTYGSVIGAGYVLDICPNKTIRFDNQVIKYLDNMDKDIATAIEAYIQHSPHRLYTLDDLSLYLSSAKTKISNEIKILIDEGKIIALKSSFISQSLLNKLNSLSLNLLSSNSDNQVLACNKATLLKQIQKAHYLPEDDLEQWFEYAVKMKTLYIDKGKIFGSKKPSEPMEASEDSSRIWLAIELSNLRGCSIGDLKELGITNINQHINELIREEQIVRLNQSTFMSKYIFEEAFHKFKEIYNPEVGVTLADYKNSLSISRKPAQQLLEAFDARNLTIRKGDSRYLR